MNPSFASPGLVGWAQKPSDSKMTLTRLGRTSGLLASVPAHPHLALWSSISSHLPPWDLSAPLSPLPALRLHPCPLLLPSLPRLFCPRMWLLAVIIRIECSTGTALICAAPPLFSIPVNSTLVLSRKLHLSPMAQAWPVGASSP